MELYADDWTTIHHGDCLDVMAEMPPESVDAIVTDPPYGLSFMGRDWDHGVPGEHFWREALRVAKPGAHLVAFGGTRTFHRLTVAIEDAGWEIRDCLGWLYGSGFPKSLDVSKAIDKAAGAEREVVETKRYTRASDASFAWQDGQKRSEAFKAGDHEYDITTPATEAAERWQGWGTALKPAWEPIILARKPLTGTVATNVQRYGTGALNIDGCRIETDEVIEQSGELQDMARSTIHDGYDRPGATMFRTGKPKERSGPANTLGRWPANIVHDGSDEVLAVFPIGGSNSNVTGGASPDGIFAGTKTRVNPHDTRANGGSAARFFYTAKASKSERDEGLADSRNFHPTVKPLDLMRWLVRLVTPPDGVVLDPFMGSGTTLKAARAEGHRSIGIDLEADHCEIAWGRLSQTTLC